MSRRSTRNTRARRAARLQDLTRANELLLGALDRSKSIARQLAIDNGHLRSRAETAVRELHAERSAADRTRHFQGNLVRMVSNITLAHRIPTTIRHPKELGGDFSATFYRFPSLSHSEDWHATTSEREMRESMRLLNVDVVRDDFDRLLHARVRLADGQVRYAISESALEMESASSLVDCIAPEIARQLAEALQARRSPVRRASQSSPCRGPVGSSYRY